MPTKKKKTSLGLLVVTGRTGDGKSKVMTQAMKASARRLIHMEEPIEMVVRPPQK